jgi:hypothetical protein
VFSTSSASRLNLPVPEKRELESFLALVRQGIEKAVKLFQEVTIPLAAVVGGEMVDMTSEEGIRVVIASR